MASCFLRGSQLTKQSNEQAPALFELASNFCSRCGAILPLPTAVMAITLKVDNTRNCFACSSVHFILLFQLECRSCGNVVDLRQLTRFESVVSVPLAARSDNVREWLARTLAASTTTSTSSTVEPITGSTAPPARRHKKSRRRAAAAEAAAALGPLVEHRCTSCGAERMASSFPNLFLFVFQIFRFCFGYSLVIINSLITVGVRNAADA